MHFFTFTPGHLLHKNIKTNFFFKSWYFKRRTILKAILFSDELAVRCILPRTFFKQINLSDAGWMGERGKPSQMEMSYLNANSLFVTLARRKKFDLYQGTGGDHFPRVWASQIVGYITMYDGNRWNLKDKSASAYSRIKLVLKNKKQLLPDIVGVSQNIFFDWPTANFPIF